MNNALYEKTMSLLGLIFLWAFWHYLWKPQRVDIFRQKLFALRSDLFDIAANGTVSFDHPAYTQLRLLINGMIRFAHRASVPTLIVARVQPVVDSPTDSLIAWKKSVSKLPQDAQKEILSIYSGVSHAFANHVVEGSPTLAPYIFLRVFVAVVRSFSLLLLGKRDLRNFTVSSARKRIDREANHVTKKDAAVIESRVLFEEQRRISTKSHHAYAL